MQTFDSGIILFAKKAGKTSFSSLWDIKHALQTKKVGHTGTLDSFADGLLVVLSGSLTRLVSHVTNFTKTYEAVICFGVETDTLDPSGTPIKTAPLPSKKQLESCLSRFTGVQSQIPPAYSAVHVNGKRASDLAREGRDVEIQPRSITVYSLDLVSTDSEHAVKYAHIKVRVSKGTYIRSLARDIAYACSSCSHLVKLRRTHVGPYSLSDACFADELEEFSLSMLTSAMPAADEPGGETHEPARLKIIQDSLLPMTEEAAAQCGFSVVVLRKEYEPDYFHGRPLFDAFFNKCPEEGENAVFLEHRVFCGVIRKVENHLQYSFVVPKINAAEISFKGRLR